MDWLYKYNKNQQINISLLQVSNISQIFIYSICVFYCPYKNLIYWKVMISYSFNYLLKTQQVFLILEMNELIIIFHQY